ncbi:teleost multiple tissue opsin 2b isoform X2 [Takifugu flavidus]|uniref:teleost multiple tissue opsin 2b isoform X2 n=1 Tax=Takifugu flavidus TaxID=433684 RepID=UPI0025445908|nr:teleost multiple tissue opsin 2b isoform X2 [Takifugu flavidus]
MESSMFSGQAGLNYSFNLSDDRELLDAPAGRAKLSPTGFVLLSVVLGFIMTFGFLNNFVVLLLFCKFKKLRTPVNMLLLNISVSDMLVCLFGTTLSFASSIRGRWLLGRSGCSWYGFINSCFGIVSLISLVILSYDRYSTLTVYNKQGINYRKPLLAVGGTWLYSLFWTVPPLLGWSSYGIEGAGTSCSVSWTVQTAQSHAYIICLFTFCLGIPVLVMIYCYSRLLWAVKQVGRIRKTAARKREYHILFMVVTTAACYLVCWMPYGVVAMMATFGPPNIISPVASVVPSLLAKSSTVINPLIYILMNKQNKDVALTVFHLGQEESGDAPIPPRNSSTGIRLCSAQVDVM